MDDELPSPSLDDMQRGMHAMVDELFAFTRLVRRLAEVDALDEPEIVTFVFVMECLKAHPERAVKLWKTQRDAFARELADVIVQVG